jgi:hypothetical protein
MNQKITETQKKLTATWIAKKSDVGSGASWSDCRYIKMDEPELPEVGQVYAVGMHDDTTGDDGACLTWSQDARIVADGWAGNSDFGQRSHHGWRGTTNGDAFYGCGVRECVAVTRNEFQKSVHYRIVFGSDRSI